jgi:hypothetical protein
MVISEPSSSVRGFRRTAVAGWRVVVEKARVCLHALDRVGWGLLKRSCSFAVMLLVGGVTILDVVLEVRKKVIGSCWVMRTGCAWRNAERSMGCDIVVGRLEY